MSVQDRVTERLDYLVRASALLGSSLDYEQTLMQLAHLLVPHLADWCSVDLMDDPDTIRNVAVAHVDPSKIELAKELQRRYPPDPHAPSGIPHVVETGQPELFREIADAMIEESAVDDEHLRMIRRLGSFRSAVIAPLSARGRSFGTITLVSGESGRIYDEDDVVLAEQLGQRAGLAIDNAQLYQAEKEATARLQLLVEMSELMTRSLGYETSLARLAEVAIEHLADFCIIDVLDDEGGLERITAVHRDPAKQQFAEQLKEWAPSMENAQNPVVRAIGSGQPQHGALEETLVAAIASNESHLQAIRGLQGAAYMCLPLIARGRVLGALTMGSERPYREETFDLATEFARRAAMAIDNARLFTDRARVADMLQRSLLPPSLPDILGVEVAASFRAAGAGSEVGGDFYDLFQLPGEAWAIAIGDVCGRGAEAAAATALARHSIRGGALRGEQPKEVLSMLNEEVLSSGDDRFCTVVFATLTPHPRSAQLTLARGGHPAPILVRSAGDARRLEPAGSLIGVFDSPDFDHETVDLFPGDFVVFYTDGVTERARSLQGEDQLVELLVSYAGLEAEAIVKRLDQAIMGTEKKGLEDDVAVLVLRVQPVAEQAAHLSGEDDAAPNP